jgi:hypothetical protein
LLAAIDVCEPHQAMAAKTATAVLEAQDKFKKDADDGPVCTLVLDFEGTDDCVVVVGTPSADEYELASCLVKSVELDADHWAQYISVVGLPGTRMELDGTLVCTRCNSCLPNTYAHECDQEEVDEKD